MSKPWKNAWITVIHGANFHPLIQQMLKGCTKLSAVKNCHEFEGFLAVQSALCRAGEK